MKTIEKYKVYLQTVRRYSPRTVDIYVSAVEDFAAWLCRNGEIHDDNSLIESLIPSLLREYVYHMLNAKPPKAAKTVNLHLSALSGLCQYLIKEKIISSNPVKLIPKPKVEKRLPHFFRKEAMENYYQRRKWIFDKDAYEAFENSCQSDSGKQYYSDLMSRVIISALYSLGIRRAELISLSVGDIDFGRKIVKVHGKGDKMREIPLIPSLSEELLLYLKAVETVCGCKRSLKEPLFVTYTGKQLYPAYVDKIVKKELEGVEGITGRKSPHVLRHSLATGLMNEDASLNSIKEMLGHSSLASTQVYTHSNIARLKNIYEQAHPRVKNGGKHGD